MYCIFKSLQLYFLVMIKSIINFLIIFFIFPKQLEYEIYRIDQNGYDPFCDETLHTYDLEARKCRTNKKI